MEDTQVADNSFGDKQGAAEDWSEQGYPEVHQRQVLLAWENQEAGSLGEPPFQLKSSLSMSDLGEVILGKVKSLSSDYKLSG